jgi:hypothetical protein
VRRRRRLLRASEPLDGRDETIAAPGYVLDVSVVRPAVVEDLAQSRDVEPEAGFFDVYVSPDALQERVIGDDFPGVLDENDEQVECPATDLKRIALLLQPPLGREKTKRSERQNRTPSVGHAQAFRQAQRTSDGMAVGSGPRVHGDAAGADTTHPRGVARLDAIANMAAFMASDKASGRTERSSI